MDLSLSIYPLLGKKILSIAQEVIGKPRVAITLEGGYHPHNMGKGVVAFLSAFLSAYGLETPHEFDTSMDEGKYGVSADEILKPVKDAHKAYWKW